MDELQPLIDAYRARATLSAKSRLDVLMAIEQIHDRRVVPFLLDVLEDPREAEAVRIYALQQLHCRHDASGSAVRTRVVKVIGGVLTEKTFAALRIQAALALGDFTQVDEVPTWLNAVCLAQEESIDLRYAAFTSLERAGPTPGCIELLRHMTNDETLGLSARSVLAAWHIEGSR